MPATLNPLGKSAQLRRQLIKHSTQLGKAIGKLLTVERLTAILGGKGVRLDAEGDPLDTTLRAIRLLAETRTPTDVQNSRMIQRWGIDIARTSIQNYKTQVGLLPEGPAKKKVEAAHTFPTVDPLKDDRIKDTVLEVLNENIRLVQGLEDDTNEMLRRTIARAIRDGHSPERLHKEIQRRFVTEEGPKFSIARVDTIVRDQTQKIHGAIQQAQFEEAGLKRYIWRTVGDERVRPIHDDRDGKIFEWSNPPNDGHPGEPINCRCSPEIVDSDI